MDETILIVIVLIAIIIPCAISYLFVRFAPKLRYFPSVLLLAVGLFFLFSAAGTKPTGGGISGFSDFGIIAGIVLGGIAVLAAGATFIISLIMYKLRRSRSDA